MLIFAPPDHAELLDLIGLGPDSVMIIHGGGIYGDKPAALARIKENIKTRLPAHVRARLVLENDEICYSAEDLLPLCEELDIPLVFGAFRCTAGQTSGHFTDDVLV